MSQLFAEDTCTAKDIISQGTHEYYVIITIVTLTALTFTDGSLSIPLAMLTHSNICTH